MALTEWTETTTDAASVTKAAVVGSSHYITGLHVSLMADIDSSDVPEAASVQLKDGTTVIFNSALVSNTDDMSAYNYGAWGGFPLVDVQFPHPLKISSGALASVTIAGISGSLTSDTKRRINLFGYTLVDTEVSKEATKVLDSTGEAVAVKADPGAHTNPGTSDSSWWRS